MPSAEPAAPPPPWRVLVFPSANEPGLEVVAALAKSNKVVLFGGSSYDTRYDPSRALLAHHVRWPALEDSDFRPRFEALLAEHAIDLVIPTVDGVVAELAGWPVRRTRWVVPPASSARLLLSKRATYRRLRGVVPVPDVYAAGETPLPAFAKPDVGSGSRGGRLVTTASELRAAVEAELLVHEHLPGEEVTVDCFSDRDGRLRYARPRVRGHVSRGIALGTAFVARTDLEELVGRIAAAIPLAGPWFAQFKAARDGTPTLLEVNARVAGSMTLSRLAGVNVPLLAVFSFMGWEVEVPRPVEGLTLNRSLRNLGEMAAFDWAVWDLDDTLIRKDGKPDPDAMACLYDLHNRGVRQLLLTRNAEHRTVLERGLVPPVFVEMRTAEDKLTALDALLRAHAIEPGRCVLVNDSARENLAIQRRHPALRVLMPDALEALAREPAG